MTKHPAPRGEAATAWRAARAVGPSAGMTTFGRAATCPRRAAPRPHLHPLHHHCGRWRESRSCLLRSSRRWPVPRRQRATPCRPPAAARGGSRVRLALHGGSLQRASRQPLTSRRATGRRINFLASRHPRAHRSAGSSAAPWRTARRSRHRTPAPPASAR